MAMNLHSMSRVSPARKHANYDCGEDHNHIEKNALQCAPMHCANAADQKGRAWICRKNHESLRFILWEHPHFQRLCGAFCAERKAAENTAKPQEPHRAAEIPQKNRKQFNENDNEKEKIKEEEKEDGKAKSRSTVGFKEKEQW